MGQWSPRQPTDFTCCVCFSTYDTYVRRPWDLGCGHCVCEPCYSGSKAQRGSRRCPECRSSFNNPHPQFALLRILETRQKILSHPIVELDDDPVASFVEHAAPLVTTSAVPAKHNRRGRGSEISPNVAASPATQRRLQHQPDHVQDSCGKLPSAPPASLLLPITQPSAAPSSSTCISTALTPARKPSPPVQPSEQVALLRLPPHHYWHQPASTQSSSARPSTSFAARGCLDVMSGTPDQRGLAGQQHRCQHWVDNVSSYWGVLGLVAGTSGRGGGFAGGCGGGETDGWGTEWDDSSDTEGQQVDCSGATAAAGVGDAEGGWEWLLLGGPSRGWHGNRSLRTDAQAMPRHPPRPSEVLSATAVQGGQVLLQTWLLLCALVGAHCQHAMEELHGVLEQRLPSRYVPDVRLTNYWVASLLAGLAAYCWRRVAAAAPLMLTALLAVLTWHLPVWNEQRLVAPLKAAAGVLTLQSLVSSTLRYLLPPSWLPAAFVAGWVGRLLLLAVASQAAVELCGRRLDGPEGVRARLCTSKAVIVLAALVLTGRWDVALWAAAWLQKAFIVHQLCAAVVAARRACQRRWNRHSHLDLPQSAATYSDAAASGRVVQTSRSCQQSPAATSPANHQVCQPRLATNRRWLSLIRSEPLASTSAAVACGGAASVPKSAVVHSVEDVLVHATGSVSGCSGIEVGSAGIVDSQAPLGKVAAAIFGGSRADVASGVASTSGTAAIQQEGGEPGGLCCNAGTWGGTAAGASSDVLGPSMSAQVSFGIPTVHESAGGACSTGTAAMCHPQVPSDAPPQLHFSALCTSSSAARAAGSSNDGAATSAAHVAGSSRSVAAAASARPALQAAAARLLGPLSWHMMLCVATGALLFCAPDTLVAAGGKGVWSSVGRLLACLYRVATLSCLLSVGWGYWSGRMPAAKAFLVRAFSPSARVIGGHGGWCSMVRLAAPVLLPVLLANTACPIWPCLQGFVATLAQDMLLLSAACELVAGLAADAWQLCGPAVVHWWWTHATAVDSSSSSSTPLLTSRSAQRSTGYSKALGA